MRPHTKDPVVLLIEEDELVRESLGDMLTERGYAAVAVATPSNGMLLLERGFRPRVIVLDPFTPNGAAAFKERLAADPALIGTPVVLGPRGASAERHIRRTPPREHH